MAEAAGFEPANAGVKVLRLTTWPRPNIKQTTMPSAMAHVA